MDTQERPTRCCVEGCGVPWHLPHLCPPSSVIVCVNTSPRAQLSSPLTRSHTHSTSSSTEPNRDDICTAQP